MSFLPDVSSPAEQNVQSVKETSVFGTIAKAAVTMVAYGIGIKAFRGLSFRADVGLGKLALSLSSKNTPAAAAISRSLGRESQQLASKASKSLLRAAGRTPSLKEAVAPIIEEGGYKSNITGVIDKVRGSIQGSRLGNIALDKAGELRDIRLTSLISNTDKFRNSALGRIHRGLNKDLGVARRYKNTGLLSVLRGSGKLGRDAPAILRGRMYGAATFMASTAAFEYTAYNIGNPSSTKKWYDPRKMAEWATFSVGSYMAFNRAIPAAKSLASLGARGIKSTLRHNDIGKQFITKVLSSAQRINNNVSVVAAQRSFDRVKALHDKENNPGMQAIKYIKGFADEFAKNRLLLKDPARIRSGLDLQTRALSQLREASERKSGSLSKFLKKESLKNIREQYSKNDPNVWVNRINELFGTDLKSSKYKSGNLQGAYKGSGYIQSGRSEIDISRIMPGNVINKTLNFLNDSFSIGISKEKRFYPLSMLGFKPISKGAESIVKLYTHDMEGAVDIGVGYDKRVIDTKIRELKNSTQAEKLLENELLDSPDGAHVKLFKEKMKAFEKGELGKRESLTGKDAILYDQIERISKERKDLLQAKSFVDRIVSRDPVLSDEAGVNQLLLNKGVVKLESENENILSIGKELYYNFKSQGKWKTHRIGYDVNKSTYHQFLNIDGAQAEGLKRIVSAAKAYDNKSSIDDDGAMGRVSAGLSSARTERILPENAGAFRRIWSLAKDKLQIGNKPERSIFEILEDYGTKTSHPKQLRYIQHMVESDPSYIKNIGLKETGDLGAFVPVMKSHMRKAKITQTDKLTRQSSFIEVMTETMRNKPMGPADSGLYKACKEGDLFLNEKNVPVDLAEATTKLKKNAQLLLDHHNINMRDGAPDQLKSAIQGGMSGDDIVFLRKMASTGDGIATLGEYFDVPSKITNREMYNNLAFRTYYHGLDTQKKTQLLTHLQNNSRMQHLRQDIKLAELSDTINVWDNINLESANDEVKKSLVDWTTGQMSKHKGAMRRLIDINEPHHSPSNLHDNLKYPSPKYQPLNVALSLNVGSEGQRIYTTGEQLLGRTRDGSAIVNTLMTTQISRALNAVNNAGNIVGIGFKDDAIKSVGSFGKHVLMRRILPAMGIAAAYKTTDAFLDDNPIFDGTSLGEGLSPLMANVIGQSRLAMAGVNDMLGITATSKYLEDIMPGFVTSPLSNTVRAVGGPLAGLNLGFKLGGPTGSLIGGSIGAAIGLMTAGGPAGIIGKYDVSKSRAELIEEYAGRREVAVNKGAGWLMGLGPVKGQRILNYEPNWYSQIMSQVNYTQSLYGSKTERLLAPLDPNHYLKKHALSRPYPVSEQAFAGTPMIGNIIGMGGGLTNEEELKYAVMANSMGGGNLNLSGQVDVPKGINQENNVIGGDLNTQNSLGIRSGTTSTGAMGLARERFTPAAQLPGSFAARTQAAYAQITDVLGFRGFLSESIISSTTDGLMPYEDIPKLESASNMTSPFRAYWDAELGDLGGVGEMLRRYIPKHGKHVNEVNPLRNTMPSWLTHSNELANLDQGDPFTSVRKGEMRLPGPGYESIHSVRYAMPLETQYLGKSIEDQVAILTGNYVEDQDERMERYMKKSIVDSMNQQLTMANQEAATSKEVFDVHSNLSGKIDVMLNGKAVNVHVVSNETFNEIGIEPLPHHAAAVNANLVLSRMPYGGVLYHNADTGETKMTDVAQNSAQFQADINRIMSAKGIAKDAIQKYGPGVGMNLASAYSRMDRLAILGDLCVHPDTLIVVDNYDLKKAIDIEKDNMVISHTGNKKTISRIGTRYYNDSLYNIKVDGINLDINKFTKEHPILKVHKSYIDLRKDKKVGVIRYVNNYIERFRRQFDISKFEWCRADEIQKGDVVAYPIPKKYSFPTIIDITEELKSTIDMVEENGKLRKRSKGSILTINRYIEIDSNFCYFLGLFLAEGSIDISTYNNSIKGITFTLHEKEENTIGQFIINYLQNITSAVARVRHNSNGGKGIHITFNSTILGELLKHICRGKYCYDKKIPNWALSLPSELQMNIVYGFIIGDGHLRYKKQTIVETKITNINIIFSIHNILLQNNIISSIREDKKNGNNRRDTYILRIYGNDAINIANKIWGIVIPEVKEYRRRIGWIKDGYVYRKVTKINIEHYEGNTYNWSVDEDSSFCIIGYITHNSPYSDEFQNTYRQVKAQRKAGLLTKWDEIKLKNIEAQRENKMDRYFINDYKFNRGTAITEDESKYQKYVNENYSAAEKIMGSIWERASHLQTPFHAKGLNQLSAIEAYERMEVKGTEIRDWGSPYQAFVRPFATSALSRDNPAAGALSFGTAGMVFGGPVGMAAGAALGAAYGTLNPGLGTIPGYRQRERELTAQLDKIRYNKASDLYNTTGSIESKKEMERTMTYQMNNATTTYAMFSAVPKHERGFMRPFAQAGTIEERERIRELVPEYVRPVLEAAWSGDMSHMQSGKKILDSYETPNENWSGWNADIKTDDIAVKMFDRAGLSAYDIGLGWQKQIREMKYTPGIPDSFASPMKDGNMAASIRSIVQSIVPDAMSVDVVSTSVDGISVTLV